MRGLSPATFPSGPAGRAGTVVLVIQNDGNPHPP